MKFTIFGGEGFIGQSLAKYLKEKGYEVLIPSREADEIVGINLGHVIYAIGLTADFRSRLYDTVDAHVCKLKKVLSAAQFDSWLYLSSTRVYGSLSPQEIAHEDKLLPVLPGVDGIYNISKLMGESLCVTHPNSNVRVVRLSNVCGVGQSQNFLGSLVDEIIRTGEVTINETPNSSKDYISLSDVLPVLEKIALFGQERTYNLASGTSIFHYELGLKLAELTGGRIYFPDHAPFRMFPTLDTSRICREFGFIATKLDNFLPEIVAASRHK